MDDKALNKEEKKEVAISFKNIVFGYDKSTIPFITNLSFEINNGDYVCIVGGNGSGKSTISKIISGLLRPWSGEIEIFDKVINKTNSKILHSNIGIIFQNPDNQFIGLTAEDDIAFGLENYRINPTQIWDIIYNSAQIVEIQNLLKLDASQLSGGQKQKVAIASVIALNPKIIIFDESTSMLDPLAKIELKQLMFLLCKKFKKTIISVTHDMEEIVDADKVLVIKDGKVEKYGKPANIFENRDFLKNNHLDIPFVLKLSQLISNKNNKVNLTLDRNKLLKEIDSLCKK